MKQSRLSKRFLESRQSHSPDGDHNSNWAISYGDMITLLLAFFVMFFSVDKDKGDIVLLGKLVEREFASEVEPPPEKVWGVPTKEDQGVYAGIDPKAADALGVKTTLKGNRLVVEFPDVSFFGTADYKISEDGRLALARFAQVFSKFSGKMRLIVRGYTDNRPVKGLTAASKFSDNLELSSLRAISALRVMEQVGIPLSLMRIGGYGETDKAAVIGDKKQMALDRKIVLVVEPLDQTERNAEVKDWERVPASNSPIEPNSSDKEKGEML